MEHTNGSVLERSGSDLKLWIQEMEINVKEHGQRVKEVRDEEGEAKVSQKENITLEKAKVASGSGTSSSQTQIGRKGKQILTEAEREAKRLRRILANRVSARQTILRRQAIREELEREVAALSSENQHMKMEKEITMQEYHSLKEANRKLKEQLAWLSMSQSMSHYMWGPWFHRVQNYVKFDSNNANGSGPSFDFSRNSFFNPQHGETHPSNDSEHFEEKQFIPNALESEVSCSLTLGLETKKLKTPSTEISHDKIAAAVECMEESEMVKVPPALKAAAEARRKRWEIINLKKLQYRDKNF